MGDSMKGLGTEDNNLIRLVVSRCEIDMWNIKQRFGQTYGNGKTLKNWIEGDVSGAYKTLLLKLCGYEGLESVHPSPFDNPIVVCSFECALSTVISSCTVFLCWKL